MTEVPPQFVGKNFQPGQSGNPKGNLGWSTRPISKVIAEFLEKDLSKIDKLEINERFKSKSAKEAFVQALFEEAIGCGDNGGSIAAKKLLAEYSDGKPQQRIDVTSKDESINTPSSERLDKMIAKLSGDVTES